MTRDEIMAMKPGRELDAEIALRVFGIKEVTVVGKHYFIDPLDKVLPPYCTDIAAAWEVVEEMGDCLHLRQHGEQGEWEAWFCGYPNSKAHGETAPEAICKAALLAVMEKEDSQ